LGENKLDQRVYLKDINSPYDIGYPITRPGNDKTAADFISKSTA